MFSRDVPKLISAGTLMECRILVGREIGLDALENVQTLLTGANIEIVPFDAPQCEIGVSAYLLYGKGSGHKAQLNFGDCFAYALAKARNLPLLFKGSDFVHTDIEPALRPA